MRFGVGIAGIATAKCNAKGVAVKVILAGLGVKALDHLEYSQGLAKAVAAVSLTLT